MLRASHWPAPARRWFLRAVDLALLATIAAAFVPAEAWSWTGQAGVATGVLARLACALQPGQTGGAS